MKNGLKYVFTVIILLIINLLNTAFAATYYFDDINGNDLNNGKSITTAWQSLKKVNNTVFQPNDSILFIRGGNWRGTLIPKSGSTLGYITYSDYGTGEKPTFLGSLDKSASSDWVSEGANIWSSAISFSVDIGNLIFSNASSVGFKKWVQTDLKKQGDFYYDKTTRKVKLFSTNNPASTYATIECALRTDIITHSNVSYVCFKNLALKYGAGHGFGGSNSHHLFIQSCDISFMGGGDLNGTNLRYGNGVEFWGNAHDNTVEGCKIWEIYDSGLSNQSNVAASQQYNIYYRNNIVYNCTFASYEFWNQSASAPIVNNIYVENNTFVNSGKGWGVQRTNGGGSMTGAHILLGANYAQSTNFIVRNNILYSGRFIISMPPSASAPNYSNLKFSNNSYYQKNSTDTILNLQWANAFNTTTYTSNVAASIKDSEYMLINPLLKDYQNNDFHIVSTSPVIGKGLLISVLNDFDGEARSVNSIDIGADQYYGNTVVTENAGDKQNLFIYPNPVRDLLTISYAASNQKESIQIFNLLGGLVKEFEMSQTTTINIADLPKGLYVICLKNKLMQAQKLIKL